uniref:Zinc knuckle family protein n=1 Tax=Oryza sativa subsp. japonica TaxID=39947 RepID=Q2QWS1_ORYSJ|nr:Zinc knuckle family protein [Oryza sativa Japonica Group]
MASNMSWSKERLQTRQRGIHTIKEIEMLAAKLDLLMKRLDDHDKRPQGTIKALDSHVTCEICGSTGHSRNDCPETREEAMYMGNNNNGYRPQGGQGWNQPRLYYQGGNNNGNFSNQHSLKDLVFAQAKTTDALSKKLTANDKILENINVKLDVLVSAFQNQLSFNKMIETQLAQLALLVPANEYGRIPRQPDSSIENVKAITTKGGTNGIAKEAPSSDSVDKKVQPEKVVPQEYCATQLLPFPQRSRKPSVDEQFARFVEVIQNIHINVLLLDAMQVPTYARYLKDILNNKRSLPTTEVVKLTKQCSNVILHKLPEKKKDLGCPTITCSIAAQQFDQALCDLGASVSVMPKDIFDKLNFTVLAPIPMHLQLADSSIRYPAGIVEDVLVKIRDFFIPVDFVVLVEVEPPKTDSLVKFMQNFLEKETTMPRNRYWKTPVKSSIPAKKLEQPAQRKPSSTPKSKRAWKEKPKTPAPSPPETSEKSGN